MSRCCVSSCLYLQETTSPLERRHYCLGAIMLMVNTLQYLPHWPLLLFVHEDSLRSVPEGVFLLRILKEVAWQQKELGYHCVRFHPEDEQKLLQDKKSTTRLNSNTNAEVEEGERSEKDDDVVKEDGEMLRQALTSVTSDWSNVLNSQENNPQSEEMLVHHSVPDENQVANSSECNEETQEGTPIIVYPMSSVTTKRSDTNKQEVIESHCCLPLQLCHTLFISRCVPFGSASAMLDRFRPIFEPCLLPVGDHQEMGEEKGFYDVVVVRDADRLVTAEDATLIHQWLKDINVEEQCQNVGKRPRLLRYFDPSYTVKVGHSGNPYKMPVGVPIVGGSFAVYCPSLLPRELAHQFFRFKNSVGPGAYCCDQYCLANGLWDNYFDAHRSDVTTIHMSFVDAPSDKCLPVEFDRIPLLTTRSGHKVKQKIWYASKLQKAVDVPKARAGGATGGRGRPPYEEKIIKFLRLACVQFERDFPSSCCSHSLQGEGMSMNASGSETIDETQSSQAGKENESHGTKKSRGQPKSRAKKKVDTMARKGTEEDRNRGKEQKGYPTHIAQECLTCSSLLVLPSFGEQALQCTVCSPPNGVDEACQGVVTRRRSKLQAAHLGTGQFHRISDEQVQQRKMRIVPAF